MENANAAPQERIYFNISFKERIVAREAGARWDKTQKMWYARNDVVRCALLDKGFEENVNDDDESKNAPTAVNDACATCKLTLNAEAFEVYPCCKCRLIFCVACIKEQECKCWVCVPCFEKYGNLASHVFFCERYGIC
jgi:hypothetical protein